MWKNMLALQMFQNIKQTANNLKSNLPFKEIFSAVVWTSRVATISSRTQFGSNATLNGLFW